MLSSFAQHDLPVLKKNTYAGPLPHGLLEETEEDISVDGTLVSLVQHDARVELPLKLACTLLRKGGPFHARSRVIRRKGLTLIEVRLWLL